MKSCSKRSNRALRSILIVVHLLPFVVGLSRGLAFEGGDALLQLSLLPKLRAEFEDDARGAQADGIGA